MRLVDLLRGKSALAAQVNLIWAASEAGLTFGETAPATSATTWASGPMMGAKSRAILDELVVEGLADATGEHVHIGWSQLHEIAQSRSLGDSLDALGLPKPIDAAPKLRSRGTLTDPDFAIELAGWVDRHKRPVALQGLCGSLLQVGGQARLMPASAWHLLSAIREFAAQSSKTPSLSRSSWGKIRRLALEADADVDSFLMKNVVLAPDKLDIGFRKVNIADTTVVEIEPTFEGAPPQWLSTFDGNPEVRSHYALPCTQGVVHIELPEATQSVLREIKRWPGRRASGARAEAFLLNPIAALGDDAADVIDTAQFEHAKSLAGVKFDRFRPVIVTDAAGYPSTVGLAVETSQGDPRNLNFGSDAVLGDFTRKLRNRLERGLQLLAWDEYEFALDGDAALHLTALEAALTVRTRPPVVIPRDKVFDLSTYSDRVIEIGEDQPYISSYIVKKSDENGWFPKNLLAVFKFRPPGMTEDVTVPLSMEVLPEMEAALDRAKAAGAETVSLPGSAHDLPTPAFETAVQELKAALVDPPLRVTPAEDTGSDKRRSAPTLVIKGNIDTIEHHETRADALAPAPHPFAKPRSLKASTKLRDHQIAGVARLQHLFGKSPQHCRGVLLADDMGLGKTIQILTFIMSALEADPNLPPALIVAPVALLENWREEIGKFFDAGGTRILTAYGDDLARLRVPKAQIDAALLADGLVKFLKPGWREGARIVLTTYETLRDLEFAFAAEPWSILVCDEAQKVKNPNARVTRAAKKLNVRFRIACTGTPVENSLTDLWCLFDMIQPGLLGALNEFGRTYGRPIESEGEGAGEVREQLRAVIDPQVIRRTKADVAKDLPRKIEVPNCTVPMSDKQRAIYVNGLRLFGADAGGDDDETPNRVHVLGLLQHFRLVCADPRQYGVQVFVPEEPAAYRRSSPKLDWLLRCLKEIKAKGEKALIFAEHRDIQRLLKHYIDLEFGLKIRIVNGDTSVSAKAEGNRKRVIDDFQNQPGFGAIILSPLAVGFGVNIQAANHVIHYLRHWNPAKEDQATDRAYRIGQTKHVHVYCPLVKADDFDTFDVKLDAFLRRKRSIAGDMLQGAGQLGIGDIKITDIIPPGSWAEGSRLVTADDVLRSSPDFLEALAATLWAKQGYRCRLTPQSDAGVDVVGVNGHTGVLIQCKSSATERALGWDAVRDVTGGAPVYGEMYPTVTFRKIGVTNQTFNSRAHERAKATGVELVEQTQLIDMLTKASLTLADVLSAAGDRL